MKRFFYIFLILTSLCVSINAQAIRRAAPMATVGGGGGIAEVGAGSQRATTRSSSADPHTLAYPGSVTSGNLLVVVGGHISTGITNITDTVGTSYSIITAGVHANGERPFIAYGIAAGSGANTVSVNLETGNYSSYAIDEFSGVHATPLDVDGGSSTGESTTPSDSITTVATNALIIGGVFNTTVTTTITPGGSYTQFGEEEDWTTWFTYNAVFRVATTATSYSVDWTFGTSSEWVAMTASFKPA